MTYQEIIDHWNAESDDANSWHHLSEIEKVEFAFELGAKNNTGQNNDQTKQ